MTGTRYWDNMVRRIALSRNARIREHIYLGDHFFHRSPLLIPLSTFMRHIIWWGGSGDGKTTLCAQFLSQLLRFEIFSIVILDHKGSLLLANSLLNLGHQLSDANGIPIYQVKFFSPIVGASTHIFNPLVQDCWRVMTPLQRTELLLDVFGIRVTEGSQDAFFACMCELVTNNVFDWYPLMASFAELLKIIDDRDIYAGRGGNPSDWNHARHVAAMARRNASCDAINAIPKWPEESIDLTDVVCGERPTLAYFFLPCLEHARVSQSVSRMVFNMLLRVASANRFHPQKRHVLLVADEGQHLFGPSFVSCMEMAREFGVTFTLLHQSRDQLITPSGDYRSIIDYCVALQTMLSIRTPEDFAYVAKTSRENSFRDLSWAQPRYPGDSLSDHAFHPDFAEIDPLQGTQEIRIAESQKAFPDCNRVLAVSGDEQGGFVRLFRSEGLWGYGAQWVPFRWHRHLSPTMYHKLSKEPIEPLPGTITNVSPERHVGATPESHVGFPTVSGLPGGINVESTLMKLFEVVSRKS